MKVVGLTGGIASGKTTITNFLKKNRYMVHDSDSVIKKIYLKPTKKFLQHLKKIKLSTAINKGQINKDVIRNKIFENKNQKTKLEKFLHSEVKKERGEFIKKQKKKNTKIVILDIPLLFEAKLTHICDYVVLLTAPKKTRIQRAIKRKGMKKNIVLKIMKNQLGDNYKRKKSDFVINTTKTKSQSFKMILRIINNIIKRHA